MERSLRDQLLLDRDTQNVLNLELKIFPSRLLSVLAEQKSFGAGASPKADDECSHGFGGGGTVSPTLGC